MKATPFHPPNVITVATPYGQILVSDQGRTITFKLFSDLRQSEHNFYLLRYAESKIHDGITRFNVDHIIMPQATRNITLARGKARVDFVYYTGNKIHEVELKTAGHLGEDSTRKQLVELTRHCTNLTLAVPDHLRDEAEQLLSLLNLHKSIHVDTYPLTSQ